MSRLLIFGLLVAAALACDAGVFWGKGCVSPKGGEYPSPACLSGYPTGANASSSSSTLVWEKGGKGSGGPDDDGGDVFLSTYFTLFDFEANTLSFARSAPTAA